MLLGIKDCFDNWFLILRCSWIGSAMGAIPGIGASVIDWISYGHALKTEKDAAKTFGTGDVRGVIAAESATNAREGGALVPTVAFGVPASAGMAILLGAFLIHGLVPGPDMLTKHLDLTYSMVWSIAIANILGSGLCFAFSGQFAKLATLRYTLFMPGVLSLVYIGAFEATRNWGDLFSLLFFGMLGWAMKHFNWPRPPFVLGFILGEPIERYMFISIERYGVGWMVKPFVLIMFSLAALSLLGPLLQDIRSRAPQTAVAETHVPYTGWLVSFWLGLKRTWSGLKVMVTNFGTPRFATDNLFPAALLILFVVMLSQSFDWAFAARIVPTIVGIGAILFCSLSLVNEIFGVHERNVATATAGAEPDSTAPQANSHGHRVEDRASARRYGAGPRLPVLWLDGRRHAVDVDHRAHSGGAHLHYFLYAARRAREMADRHSDGGLRRGPDLRRVRPVAGNPLAADIAGHLLPDPQGDPECVDAVFRLRGDRNWTARVAMRANIAAELRREPR